MSTDESYVINGDDNPYFCYSASLRIWGDIPEPDAISHKLGLTPANVHRKGEKRGPRSPAYLDDHWSYRPPLEETRPLEEHILALWDAVRPHVAYLKSLKSTLNVDVFCGYRSNSATAGFQVGHQCLDLFVQLEIPFGVSVIIM